ncbi:MAG: hypothetical protein H7144_02915 [Burkholderiales bacterium]|nr:hypothetical protein [Phycisphaerae bacterium]
MRKLSILGLFAISSFAVGGCARPFEIGWTPAYSLGERGNLIARNWDLEGKMTQDDIDSLLMLRPLTGLTTWKLR